MQKSHNIVVLENEETNALAVALYCWGMCRQFSTI